VASENGNGVVSLSSAPVGGGESARGESGHQHPHATAASTPTKGTGAALGGTSSAYVDFLCCFLGLQCSYLVWGVMQELIMNTRYEPSPLNPSGRFPSATFCVFSNRFLAIIFAALVCWKMHGTVVSAAPFLAFTPCALSNTISSWSQYQALSFVSFSLQTLFKSTKVIPVMIMGKLLKNLKYTWVAYIEAIVITFGVLTFSFGNESKMKDDGKVSSFAGFVLLSMYILTDSFTSQWQSKVYSDYGKIDQWHMMFGVNLSSIILTVGALLLSGELPAVIEFFHYHPSSFWYNMLTAITSTSGQVAIFFTIKRFGATIFTIIMTTRQVLSIAISTILFGHPISFQSCLGALIVFVAVFHSIWRQRNEEMEKAAAKLASAGKDNGSSGKSESV
jgi:adenosine 3'-phospho 5'-phosphosulfate transporter B2